MENKPSSPENGRVDTSPQSKFFGLEYADNVAFPSGYSGELRIFLAMFVTRFTSSNYKVPTQDWVGLGLSLNSHKRNK